MPCCHIVAQVDLLQCFRTAHTIHHDSAGFLLFLVLTLALIWARPVPLTLSSPQLTEVQDQLYQFARTNWDSAKSSWSNTRRLHRQIRAEGISILPDVDSAAAAEARNFYGSHHNKRFDLKVHKAAAGLLHINWPVKRWPVYVFTIGAMACLLTSATCHLFGCCAAHLSRFIWRFDYLGIAVLIVCSFYPQVYYGKAYPGLLHILPANRVRARREANTACVVLHSA